jgi:endonuclease-3
MNIYKVKQETLDMVEEVKKEEVVTTPSKNVRSPQAKTPSTPRQPPKDWESIYELVEELRQDRSAPVDNHGSEALPQRTHGNKTFRFQVLIALMLSSQTKDAIVGETMRALQTHGLDIDNISETSPEALNALIRRVGFHNNKTKYIKETVEILKSRYDGDIPPNATEIMTLPGVGPKMAFIVENVAWNTTSGIGVDTHMHRMFNEIKWVSSKNPEQTRKQLESWLPRDLWSTVNVLWVGFGQEVQQFKPKVIRKALECSRPADALRLVKRLGVDLKKEGGKMGMEEEIKQAMKG